MKCTDRTHMSINKCGHREMATLLIENVLEPHLDESIDGDEYYDWEDELTFALAQNDRQANGTSHAPTRKRIK